MNETTTEGAHMRPQIIHHTDERKHGLGAQEALIQWCRDNGVDPETVISVEITGEGAAVFDVYAKNAAGMRYVDESTNEAAKRVVKVDRPTELPEAWR